MDVAATNPRSLDVGHEIQSLRFTFYTDDEVRALSVKEIVNNVAFDDLGRPVRGGLYDPALGTTSQKALCETCGLGYQECPGHFGHIELAVPAFNPLLFPQLFKLLRAKCWYCNQFRLPKKAANLLLAKLYWIDCGRSDEAEEVARSSSTSPELVEENSEAILEEAKAHWERAKGRRPADNRGREWRMALSEFMSSAEKGGQCRRCKVAAINLRKDGMRIFRVAKSQRAMKASKARGVKLELATKQEAKGDGQEGSDAESGEDEAGATRLVTNLELYQQLRALWAAEPDACDLIWGNGHRLSQSRRVKMDHNIFFMKVVAVPPSRFRPATKDVESDMLTEHPQNVFLGRLLTANQELLRQSAQGDSLQRTRLLLEVQAQLNMLVDSAQAPKNSAVPGATGIRQQLEHKEGLFRMHMMGKRVNHSARSVIGPDPFLKTSEVGIPVSFAKRLCYAEPVTHLNMTKLRKMVENGPDVYPGATAVEDGAGNVIRLSAKKPRQRQAQAKLLDKTRSKAAFGEEIKRVHRHMKTGDVVLFNRQPSLHRASIMAHHVRVLNKERTIRFHYANCGSYNADFDGDEMNVHYPQDEISRAEADFIVAADRQYTTPTSGMPLRGLIQDHVVAGVLITKLDTFFDKENFQQLLFSACDAEVSFRRRISLPIPAILKPRQLWSGKQLVSSLIKLMGTGKVLLNLDSKARTKADMVGDDEVKVLIRDGLLLRGVLDKNQFGSSAFGLVHAFQELYGAIAAGKLLSALSRLFTLFLRIHAHTTGIDDLLLNGQAERARLEALREARQTTGRKAVTKLVKKDEDDPALATEEQLCELVREIVAPAGGEAQLDSAMKSILSVLSSRVLESCFPAGLIKRFPRNGFALMTGTGAKGSAVNFAQISCQLGQTELEGRRVPRSASGATLPCFAPFDPSARAGGYISDRFLTGIKPPEYFFHCMAGREGLVDTAVKTARSGYLQRCLVKALEGMQLEYDLTVRDSDARVLQFLYGDDGIDPNRSSWLFENLTWQTAVDAPSDDGGTMLEEYSPGALSTFGVLSEKFWEKVTSFDVEAVGRSSAQRALTRPEFEALMALRYQRAAAEPGEAVGILAAQGIGEPSTQMTLNTFHFAGMGSAHVTLGIPRLRELLMTASKVPTTPTMNLPLREAITRSQAEDFVRRLRRVRVIDLLESIAIEDLGFDAGDGTDTYRAYTVRLQFPPEALYRKALDLSFAQVKKTVETQFARRFKAGISKNVRKLGLASGFRTRQDRAVSVGFFEVAKEGKESGGKPKPGDAGRGNEDALDDVEISEASEDEEDPLDARGGVDRNEADTTDQKRENQRGEGASYYEAPEEEEVVVEDSEDEDEEDKRGTRGDDASNMMADDDESITSEERTNAEDAVNRKKRRPPPEAMEVDEVNNAVEIPSSLPAVAWGRVMLEDVASAAATETVIRETPGVARCFLEKTDKDELYIQTEGSNLHAVWEYEEWLNPDEVMTNDVYLMLTTYGVEAARAALIKELGMVFEAYGIPVDPRHLYLIADYMTALGAYRPFNRIGMDTAPSNIQKMSFETSLKFLTEAAVNGEVDAIQSPSARVAVGSIVKCGTGMFDLRQRIHA